MLDNKWQHGTVHFILPALPADVIQSIGLKPVPLIVDPHVGTEIVLLITEHRDRANTFKSSRVTQFFTKSGLANTSFGPVCWLLFYFPHLPGGQITYENILNPKDDQQLHVYERLAKQDYWHVVFADQQGEVINFFEFPNRYGLLEVLRQIKEVCSNLEVSDFSAAKAEFQQTYNIEDLINERAR